MTDPTPERCAVVVRGGDVWHDRSRPCGRPAKGVLADGKPACGIHLRAERVSASNDAKRDAIKERRESLRHRLGLSYVGGGTYNDERSATVLLADLEALADRLEAQA